MAVNAALGIITNMIISEYNNESQGDIQSRIKELSSRASRVTPNAHGGFTCLCPAHDDNRPSLSVNPSETGLIVMNCLSQGCDYKAIMFAWGLPVSILFPEGHQRGQRSFAPKRIHGSLRPKPNRRVVDAGARDYLEDKLYKAVLYSEDKPQSLQFWAKRLGLSLDSLHAFGCGATLAGEGDGGRREYFLLVPEYSGDGELCSINTRLPQPYNGKDKLAEKGMPRGLAMARDEKPPDGPLLCFEGASDPIAAHAVGLHAIGRPNARGGADQIAIFASHLAKDVVIFGENDCKADGSWPGRDGCKAVAQEISDRFSTSARNVSWCLPPSEFKDFRDWLNRSNVDLSDQQAVATFRSGVLAWVSANAVRSKISPCPDCSKWPPQDNSTSLRIAPESSNVISHSPDKWHLCPKRYAALLRSKSSRRLEILMYLACKTWSCPACSKCLKSHWKRHVFDVLQRTGGDIYTWRGPVGEWETVVKYIRRQAGYQFIRIALPGGELAVVSNVPARPNAQHSAPIEAAQWAAELIDSLPIGKKPISTSRGAWQPPKLNLKTELWEHVGTVKQQDAEAVRAAAKEFEVVAFNEKPVFSPTSNLCFFQSWLLPPDWTEERVEQWHRRLLGHCYMLKGPLTRAQCQEFLDYLEKLDLTG